MDTISVVIPAYNESRRLPATLDKVLRYFDQGLFSLVEIIVVDDGSTDGTADAVLRYESEDSRIRLLQNPGNRGKGYAVRQGMLAAQNDWALFTDADLSTPIEELDKLLRTAKETRSSIVIGARTDSRLIGTHQSGSRETAGKAFNFFMRLISGLPFRDTQCGFKLYRRDAAKLVFSRQRLEGFSFDVEDLCIARALHLEVRDVSVRWNNAEGTRVSMAKGLQSFVDLAVIRWNEFRGCYK